MNKICSIYLDDEGPIDANVIAYLKNRYDTIFLVGQQVTTKYHTDIPYIYYNYIRYKSNIDIVFQNLMNIETIDIEGRNVWYIYDISKHKKNHKMISNAFKQIDTVLLTNKNISQTLLQNVFNFQKEVVYV
jgi:hypothetical protein